MPSVNRLTSNNTGTGGGGGSTTGATAAQAAQIIANANAVAAAQAEVDAAELAIAAIDADNATQPELDAVESALTSAQAALTAANAAQDALIAANSEGQFLGTISSLAEYNALSPDGAFDWIRNTTEFSIPFGLLSIDFPAGDYYWNGVASWLPLPALPNDSFSNGFNVFNATETITETPAVRLILMPVGYGTNYGDNEPYLLAYRGPVPHTPAGGVTTPAGLTARIAEGWEIVGPNVAATTPPMVGATASVPGAGGSVPAPVAGQQGYFLRGDGTWVQISSSAVRIDASATDVTETLSASADAGTVVPFINIDLTNIAVLSVQAGETLNGVVDATFDFSQYAAGTQFRADEVTGGWVISVVGAHTNAGRNTTIADNTDVTLVNGLTQLVYTGTNPGTGETIIESVEYYDEGSTRFGKMIVHSDDIDTIVLALGADIVPTGASLEKVYAAGLLPNTDAGALSSGLVPGEPDQLYVNKVDSNTGDFRYQVDFEVKDVPNLGQVVLAGMVNVGPIGEHKFTLTSNNSAVLPGSTDVVAFESYTESLSSGGVATFDGTELIVTAGANDIEVEGLILTAGTGTHSQVFYWRDVSDAIGAQYGTGQDTNGVSDRGVYGAGSANRAAKAVVRAGTTVTLSLVHGNSANNQRLQEGSYIRVREIAAQNTIIDSNKTQTNEAETGVALSPTSTKTYLPQWQSGAIVNVLAFEYETTLNGSFECNHLTGVLRQWGLAPNDDGPAVISFPVAFGDDQYVFTGSFTDDGTGNRSGPSNTVGLNWWSESLTVSDISWDRDDDIDGLNLYWEAVGVKP